MIAAVLGGGGHLPGGGGQPEDLSFRDGQVVQSPDQMAQTAHDLVSRFESLLQTVQHYMRVDARQFGKASFSAGYDGHAALRELLSFHQHRPDIQKLAVIVNQACKLINTSTTPILALAMCASRALKMFVVQSMKCTNSSRFGRHKNKISSGMCMS